MQQVEVRPILVSRWQKLKQKILLRRVPHTVMSWRFFLPYQSQAVKLHRKVFLHAYPNLKRWQWVLIATYSTMTWLFYFSWKLICLCEKRSAQKVYKAFQVSIWRQRSDMLSLAFLHFIPPHFYYQYGLFNKPKDQWLNYIYTHELPHWHMILSATNMSADTLHTLTDKNVFSNCMRDQGIAAVSTVALLKKGLNVESDVLFTEQSIFLKPNAGSQGRDTLELRFNEEKDNYTLMVAPPIFDKKDIIDYINKQVKQEDYLVQQVLNNHPQITELCGTTELVTLRLITGLMDGEPKPFFATLEIPKAERNQGWLLYAVDISSGKLFDDSVHIEKGAERALKGEELPFWGESLALCRQAHQQFPDLRTVGWDVVMTDSGVKILEGNINWGVASHQLLTGNPTLSSELVEIYSS